MAQDGDGKFADVTVKAVCSAEPKQVRVTNDSDFAIVVQSVSIAGDEFDFEDMDGGGNGEPMVRNDELAPGESATYTAPEGVDAQNFVVVLIAADPGTIESQEGKATVAFVGCINVDEDFEMPGMPDTGAGGVAGGAGMPIGWMAAGVTVLLAGGYAVLRRR